MVGRADTRGGRRPARERSERAARLYRRIGFEPVGSTLVELFAHRAERLSATARDFFISYTEADREWAMWIASRLDAAGQAAVTASRRTIAVLSPDYMTSVHGAAEWQAAYAEDPDGSAGRLVPVRVRECQPEGLLATRTRIDLIGLDPDGARDALLAGIERRRAKPSRAPAFPGAAPATPFPD